MFSVAWSPDGKAILSVAGNHKAAEGSGMPGQGRRVLTLKGAHRAAVTSVAGSRMAQQSQTANGISSGSWPLSGTLKGLGRGEKGRRVLTLKGHTKAVSSVAWSPERQTKSSVAASGQDAEGLGAL